MWYCTLAIYGCLIPYDMPHTLPPPPCPGQARRIRITQPTGTRALEYVPWLWRERKATICALKLSKESQRVYFQFSDPLGIPIAVDKEGRKKKKKNTLYSADKIPASSSPHLFVVHIHGIIELVRPPGEGGGLVGYVTLLSRYETSGCPIAF